MKNLPAVLLGLMIFGYVGYTAIADQDRVIRGEVTAVADGDTMTVLAKDGAEHKIRLKHVDSPEKDQPGGPEAKAWLSQYVGKNVDVQVVTTDKYGRTVSVVTQVGMAESINMKLIEVGHAWWYGQYSQDERYAIAELKARRKGVGLWHSDSDDVAPWEWRAAKK